MRSARARFDVRLRFAHLLSLLVRLGNITAKYRACFRDETGKFKDIQTYQRAHAADLRHKSKDEKESAQGPIERKVRKAANDAVKSVKRSVKGAVVAVGSAARRAVKQVASKEPSRKVAAKSVAVKPAGKSPAKKTARTALAKKPAKKAAKTR